MVAELQSQGVLSQSQNGDVQNGSAKYADAVAVDIPTLVTEHYPPNTLGCSEGASSLCYQARQVHIFRQMYMTLITQRSGGQELTWLPFIAYVITITGMKAFRII